MLIGSKVGSHFDIGAVALDTAHRPTDCEHAAVVVVIVLVPLTAVPGTVKVTVCDTEAPTASVSVLKLAVVITPPAVPMTTLPVTLAAVLVPLFVQVMVAVTTLPAVALAGSWIVVATSATRADADGRVLDHGVGEEPVAELGNSGPGRGLVGGVHAEADRLAHVHPAHLVEAEGGQRSLDGRALRVGDAGPLGHLDVHGERGHGVIVAHGVLPDANGGGPQVPAPGQSAKRRPLMRS